MPPQRPPWHPPHPRLGPVPDRPPPQLPLHRVAVPPRVTRHPPPLAAARQDVYAHCHPHPARSEPEDRREHGTPPVELQCRLVNVISLCYLRAMREEIVMADVV